MKFAAFIGVAGLAVAASAQDGLVVGVDDTTVGVYMYESGSWNLLFDGYEVWGMAGDAPNKALFFNDGTGLYSWDSANGVQSIGTINVGGTVKSMVSLAYDPRTGTLFGTSNIGGDGGATPEALYTISTTDASATVLYDYASADFDFGGIDFDPMTGKLYGVNDDSTPLGRGLFEIDYTGMNINFIVDYPGGETDIDGLGVGGGYAYFVTDEPGVFYAYDLVGGGFTTFDNPWTSSEIFSAGAFIPAPGAAALLGLGGLIATRRRR